MYRFRDTVKTKEALEYFGSEAFSINGEYLENIVPGYRTLSVSGRELLESEISTLSIVRICSGLLRRAAWNSFGIWLFWMSFLPLRIGRVSVFVLL